MRDGSWRRNNGEEPLSLYSVDSEHVCAVMVTVEQFGLLHEEREERMERNTRVEQAGGEKERAHIQTSSF